MRGCAACLLISLFDEATSPSSFAENLVLSAGKVMLLRTQGAAARRSALIRRHLSGHQSTRRGARWCMERASSDVGQRARDSDKSWQFQWPPLYFCFSDAFSGDGPDSNVSPPAALLGLVFFFSVWPLFGVRVHAEKKLSGDRKEKEEKQFWESC